MNKGKSILISEDIFNDNSVTFFKTFNKNGFYYHISISHKPTEESCRKFYGLYKHYPLVRGIYFNGMIPTVPAFHYIILPSPKYDYGLMLSNKYPDSIVFIVKDESLNPEWSDNFIVAPINEITEFIYKKPKRTKDDKSKKGNPH